jgi:hypothetical protein
MRSITFEQILLLLLFVGVPLLNLLVRWLKRARAQSRPFPPEPGAPAAEAREERRPTSVRPQTRALDPILVRADPREAPTASPPLAVVRRGRPLGGRAGVRRAVVAMTILGPCRGLDDPPPITRDPTAPR